MDVSSSGGVNAAWDLQGRGVGRRADLLSVRLGQRTCVGQNFAMLEPKTGIAKNLLEGS
jgi:hypothetical protein